MKVLVVSNMYPNEKFPFYGTFVKNFCIQLTNMNIDYDLAVMHKSKSIINKFFRYALFFFQTVFKILLFKYDIIYIHYASISSIPVLIAKKLKKNLIIYTNVHGSDVIPETKNQVRNHKYTKKILTISDKIIVPSNYFKKLLQKKYCINFSKIYVYPSGGVNSNVFRKLNTNKQILMSEFNLDPKFKYIGFVSRITRDKGWDDFCLAIKDVIKNDKKIRAIICGSGNEEKKLQDLIKKLGIQDVVIQYPSLSQEKLNKLFNIMECLVFSSKRAGESLGLVPLEAMSSGTIVLANNNAAASEYILDKSNGFLYDKNDIESLVKCIKYFLSLDYSTVNMMKKNAMKTSSTYYSKNTISVLKEIFYND